MTSPDQDSAHRLGALEAEAFEHALRATERAELARRWRIDGAAEPGTARGDFARLAQFHDAVQASVGWRLLQALRRPFGRAW